MTAEKTTKSRASQSAPSVDEKLNLLPDGADALATVHDATAQSILKLAEELVSDARSRLGRETSKPRVAEIDKLFKEHAGASPKVPEELNRDLRQPERVEQVAGLDEAWDKTFASAINVFDQTSIESGGKVQEAIDNWRLAVRVYKSEARSAGAIFKAAIEQTQAKPRREGGVNQGVDRLSDYYDRASHISAALVSYEQSMGEATNALASAMGALIGDLFSSASTVSVAEATLIDAEQKASDTFWSGVQAELENRS